METPIGWGFVGTGSVACHFAEDLATLPDARLNGVFSRTESSAQRFKALFNVKNVYQDLDELIAAADVNVIYVATPHSSHSEIAIRCLEGGKAVLCEKPFAINAKEARKVVATARSKSLFCMEGMWMRFVPLMGRLKSLLRQEVIGEIVTVFAHMGYPFETEKDHRLFDRKLGGGSLLDFGIYPLSLSSMLQGGPTSIHGLKSIGSTGVDTHASIILGFESGATALLGSSIDSASPNEAVIMGTRGTIRIHAPFYRPHRMSVSSVVPSKTSVSYPQRSSMIKRIKQSKLARRLDRATGFLHSQEKIITESFQGHGYQFEATEVMNCLRNGLKESPIMPLDESISLMETMDHLRSQWGLAYPGEELPGLTR